MFGLMIEKMDDIFDYIQYLRHSESGESETVGSGSVARKGYANTGLFLAGKWKKRNAKLDL
jgi:hypothetical protein